MAHLIKTFNKSYLGKTVISIFDFENCFVSLTRSTFEFQYFRYIHIENSFNDENQNEKNAICVNTSIDFNGKNVLISYNVKLQFLTILQQIRENFTIVIKKT